MSLEQFEVVGSFDERHVRDVTDAAQAIGCSMAKGHRPFQVWVIWFPDGYLRFVGFNCGKTHFKLSSKSLEKEVARFRKTEKREVRLRILDSVERLVSPAIDAAKTFRVAPQVKEATRVDGVSGRIANEVGIAWHFASSHGGQLYRRRVRRQRSNFSEAGGGGRYSDIEEIGYGRLDGLAFVGATKTVRLILDLAVNNLRSAEGLLAERAASELTDDEQSKALRGITEGVKGIRHAEELMTALPKLFEDAAVKKVIEFINGEAAHKKRFETYEAVPGGFRKVQSNGETVDLVLNADRYESVDLSAVDHLAHGVDVVGGISTKRIA